MKEYLFMNIKILFYESCNYHFSGLLKAKNMSFVSFQFKENPLLSF